MGIGRQVTNSHIHIQKCYEILLRVSGSSNGKRTCNFESFPHRSGAMSNSSKRSSRVRVQEVRWDTKPAENCASF